MNIKKLVMCAGVALMLAPAVASADMVQDVALDKQGDPIVDSQGDCVHTKWMVDGTVCDKESVERLKLSSAERIVYFDFNKSTLRASEKAELDSLIRAIQGSKGVTSVDIIGHADKIGTSSYNRSLSMRRANTVKAYLSKYGNIKTRNVDVRALGESDSVTSCSDNLSRAELIDCLQKDRRVEIFLNYAK